MAITFLSPADLALRIEKGEGTLILDASYFLDGGIAPAEAAYQEAAIPGAKFWDIDACADPHSSLPHMLAPASLFAAYLNGAGHSMGRSVCVYDQLGLFSAPRLAWELASYGLDQISILTGGLPAWRAADLPTEPGTEIVTPKAKRKDIALPSARRAMTLDQVMTAINRRSHQIVDARPAARFDGSQPEARAHLRRGHMHTAISLPYASVVSDGQFSTTFDLAGVDLKKPIITTCGSGITAAGLCLALRARGATNVSVYDGSWVQWADPALMTPIANEVEAA